MKLWQQVALYYDECKPHITLSKPKVSSQTQAFLHMHGVCCLTKQSMFNIRKSAHTSLRPVNNMNGCVTSQHRTQGIIAGTFADHLCTTSRMTVSAVVMLILIIFISIGIDVIAHAAAVIRTDAIVNQNQHRKNRSMHTKETKVRRQQ